MTPAPRRRSDLLILAVLAAALLAVVLVVQSQRQQQLRSSPVGFDGLKPWLNGQGIETRTFAGGWLIDESSIGLLVVPLHDTVLDQPRRQPATKKELLMQPDEYDLPLGQILAKADRVQALIVLPKWRSGMRLTRIGHPVLWVDQKAVQTILGQMTDAPMELTRSAQPFVAFDHRARRQSAKIYAAQAMTGEGCVPIVGTRKAMILGDCPVKGNRGKRVLILTDPDLMNNHGLRLGDNAHIVRDLIGDRAGTRPVIIDYSRRVWFHDGETLVERERSWADLRQFFAPPFLTLWAGGAALLLLALWRGGLRARPVTDPGPSSTASKELAVAARARLMRRSDQDGALLRDYARARMATVAAQIFGPAHARAYASRAEFIAYLERRGLPQAARLEAALTAIDALPDRIAAAQAIHHVDELEQVLEQITHVT